MDNKEGKQEPWKRGRKGMNNREGKEGSWKRGKKGMKAKEGKEEPWKRGKVISEKREGEMTNEVEKEKPSKKNLKSELGNVCSGWDSWKCLLREWGSGGFSSTSPPFQN